MSEADFTTLRAKLFPQFLETNPAAQSYVTQSATRINFVAEKIIGLTLEARQNWRQNLEESSLATLAVAKLTKLERKVLQAHYCRMSSNHVAYFCLRATDKDLYRAPRRLVEEVSAVGLRHVGILAALFLQNGSRWDGWDQWSFPWPEFLIPQVTAFPRKSSHISWALLSISFRPWRRPHPDIFRLPERLTTIFHVLLTVNDSKPPLFVSLIAWHWPLLTHLKTVPRTMSYYESPRVTIRLMSRWYDMWIRWSWWSKLSVGLWLCSQRSWWEPSLKAGRCLTDSWSSK